MDTAKQPPLRHYLQTFRHLIFTFGVFLILSRLPAACGQNATITSQEVLCTTPADTYIGNAQNEFYTHHFVNRGICVRSEDHQYHCYEKLQLILANLNEIRRAEYGGAASVLSLLPTIGALLGTPTNEIWKLMSIIPFGGGLTMLLSFGGAIMPVRVEDYEHVITKKNIAIGSIISFRNHHMPNQGPEETSEEKLKLLIDTVRKRIDQRESARLSKKYLAVGLTGMFLLFLGAQAGMTVVEQGGILAWVCTSNWWMHLWYLLGMLDIVHQLYC